MIIVAIIAFIIILGMLVIIHELGHFLMAKLFKVGVDEFGVGFPPRILARRFGKTIYSLNWIPIGGFVKIKGVVGGDQIDGPANQTELAKTAIDVDDFSHHPMWQRFCILFAGIFMNLLLAAILFSVGYMIGFPGSAGDLPADAQITQAQVITVAVPTTSLAAKAGLQTNDVIEQVNNQPVTSIQDMQAIFQASPDQVILTINRANKIETLSTILTTLPTGQRGLGVEFVATGLVRLPFFTALWYGPVTAINLTKDILIALWQLITGLLNHTANTAAISGPIGIASLTYQATELGFVYVLQLAAMLSLNLAIFNLIPLPALDGGRIFFLILELILRKPVNQKVEAIIHNVGFVLLLVLFVFVTVKDLLNLF